MSKVRLGYIGQALLVVVALVFGYLGVTLPAAPLPPPVAPEGLAGGSGYSGPCYLAPGGVGLVCDGGGGVTLNSGAVLTVGSGATVELPSGAVAWGDVSKAGSTLNDLVTLSTSKDRKSTRLNSSHSTSSRMPSSA
jgi:hypothetical protein